MQSKVEICGVNTASLTVIPAAEMTELLRKSHNGDQNAREKLIRGNLKLVLSVIQRFHGRNESVDDLFQVGCIGLMKSIDNFNCDLNVRFSTYAVPMIIGEIRRYLRDNSAIRVSRSMRDTAYRALQAKEAFLKEHQREPTITELAKALDMKKRRLCLRSMRFPTPFLFTNRYGERRAMLSVLWTKLATPRTPTSTGSHKSRSRRQSAPFPSGKNALSTCVFLKGVHKWKWHLPFIFRRHRFRGWRRCSRPYPQAHLNAHHQLQKSLR